MYLFEALTRARTVKKRDYSIAYLIKNQNIKRIKNI